MDWVIVLSLSARSECGGDGDGTLVKGSEVYAYRSSLSVGKRMLPVDRGGTTANEVAAAMLGSDISSSDSIVDNIGRNGVLLTGAGAYTCTITESGVSDLTSTGRRRSCSIGSGRGSSACPSLIDARILLARRQEGDIGGTFLDSEFGEGQARRLLRDLWLLTLLRLDDTE